MKLLLIFFLVYSSIPDVSAQITDTAPFKKSSDIVLTNHFRFKPLPYSYNGLEPAIDKETLEIHYSKHHKAYYDNFISAVKSTEMETMDIKEIFKNVSKYSKAIRNNGGGYFNHTLYWDNMRDNGGGLPKGKLMDALVKSFKSFEGFKKEFSDAGKSVFGSGWTWLCVDEKNNLFISTTPNQDNPLMDVAERKGIPLLTMDVWEHAYYLKYKNKRIDYVDAFWKVVNWDEVASRYDSALKAIVTEDIIPN